MPEPTTSPLTDPRVLAVTLDHFGLEWLITDELAARAYPGGPSPSEALLPPPVTTIAVAGSEENLDRLADALFDLAAVPATGETDWSPWPATAENLAGTYVTRAGALRIRDSAEYAACAATARPARLGGIEVQVAGATAVHREPRFPRYLAEQL